MDKILVILFAILILGFDYKVKGHPKPLENELLKDPIGLSCGVTINEYRGFDYDKKTIKKINNLCTKTLAAFSIFMDKKGFCSKIDNKNFSWYFSFIPIGTNYRDLNDTVWRFYNRDFKFVSGYTEIYSNYSWIISDPNNKLFDLTIAHELFHALSYSNNCYDTYPVETFEEKLFYDEGLAKEFTRFLELN